MMSEPIVSIDKVGVRFRLQLEKTETLKETFINFLRRKNAYRDLWALEDVTVKVMPGESIGIVGRNGSGKSTLLKVISGVYEPTTGTRAVNGTISALIELGAGFNPELTGRENVFLAGAIMGFNKAEMKERYQGIVDFAELHDFMDTPIKNFSSGMYARLGFSIATQVDADLLIIDEILGVGDEAFQKKSFGRIEAHLAAGKTAIFVSHDASAVERICQRAVVLDHGHIVHEGPTHEAIEAYRRITAAAG